VYRRSELFKEFTHIIIDECDAGTNPYSDNMYKKFLDAIGTKRVLGTTATPYKLFSNREGACLRMLVRTNPRMFYDIIHHTQIQELSDAGYLCECLYYRVGEFNVKNLQIGSSGEYTDRSTKRYYEQIKYDFSILDVAKRLINAGRKNLLVFTKFVEEAVLLARELGDIAAIVSADTPKEQRESIISDFRSGRIKIVCNCSVLSVGFDFPELETILLARSTRSLRLLYQMVARGQRISPMKENCWIVDMANNLSRFPIINDIWLTKNNGLWQYVDKGHNNKPITNVYF
jgi:DNA repair protein RadD